MGNSYTLIYNVVTLNIVSHVSSPSQSELRSLVSIGDGAAGGASSGGGGGVASGEGSKRPNTRGGLSSKKKKSSSTSQAPPLGPLLFDSSIEWWGEDKVSPVVMAGFIIYWIMFAL